MGAASEHLANSYESAQSAYDEIAAKIPEAERNVAQCCWRIEYAAGAVLVENAGLSSIFIRAKAGGDILERIRVSVGLVVSVDRASGQGVGRPARCRSCIGMIPNCRKLTIRRPLPRGRVGVFCNDAKGVAALART